MAKTRVLSLTSAEYGQANVQFAIISSLQEHHLSDVDLHLCSFESLRSRTPDGVTFHAAVGDSITTVFLAKLKNTNNIVSMAATSPGLIGTLRGVVNCYQFISPSSPEQYVATARSIEDVIARVDPALMLIDPLFEQAIDAARRSGKDYVKISPNTILEVAADKQGLGLFNWPARGVGYSYPVSWWLYPFNVICHIAYPIWFILFDSVYKSKVKARNAAGYPGPMPLIAGGDVPILCMSTPATEYPAIIPPDVICCGPILQASSPVREIDPELYSWLTGRPTVLIVLGSVVDLDDEALTIVWTACRVLLDRRKDLQILWKLQRLDSVIDKLTGLDEAGDRMRIVTWLKADPVALLRTGNVICFVSHGGSNSYHEALSAGTPQMVLSVWYDTHDMACRVEWLGVGIWGNKSTAPAYSLSELTASLLAVVGASPEAPRAAKFRARAREVSDVVMGRRTGHTSRSGMIVEDGPLEPEREGRDVAAKWIWKRLVERRRV